MPAQSSSPHSPSTLLCTQMISRLKRPARLMRSSRRSEDMTSQVVESIRIPVDVDVLDMQLFTEDFNAWFARAAFQYHLAMAIQKEHLGHSVIHPTDVLKEVEHNYSRKSRRNEGDNGNPIYPGYELFGRVNAARATKDNTTLQAFMDQLSSQILSTYRNLRTVNMAELDTDMPYSPSCIYRVETSSSSTSSSQHLEDHGEATSSNDESENPLQEDSFHVEGSSGQNKRSLAPNHEGVRPMHRYTSILYEYASRFEEDPEFREDWIAPDKWRCNIIFKDVSGIGEGRNKKEAKHVASQRICEALGILKD